MKHFIYILSFTSIMLLFTTCKKYPNGGFYAQARLHLFGGHKVGSSKTWKLKKYEVNGIDSTYLIQGANTIPDFYEKFVTFKYNRKSDSPMQYRANTFTNEYDGYIDNKVILIAYRFLTHEDSIQCKTINGQWYCARNILKPELVYGNTSTWDILKLTKKEFIITNKRLKNSYKIILSY